MPPSPSSSSSSHPFLCLCFQRRVHTCARLSSGINVSAVTAHCGEGGGGGGGGGGRIQTAVDLHAFFELGHVQNMEGKKKIDSDEFSCTATGLGREVGGCVCVGGCHENAVLLLHRTSAAQTVSLLVRAEILSLRIRTDARGRLNLRCKNIHSRRSSGSDTLRRND